MRGFDVQVIQRRQEIQDARRARAGRLPRTKGKIP